jgi:predicted RNase H-like nuclease (RuvC/YqgF family)
VNKHTIKTRVESLENWIQKQKDNIREVSDRAEKSYENVEMLKKKLDSLEEIPKYDKNKARIEKKCKLCEATFTLNCDLKSGAYMDTLNIW